MKSQAGMPLEDLMQDLRFGIRTLSKNPAFTAIAVVTLALGIGANTAIFGVVSGVLLRPLPFAQPDRLIATSSYYPKGLLASCGRAAGRWILAATARTTRNSIGPVRAIRCG